MVLSLSILDDFGGSGFGVWLYRSFSIGNVKDFSNDNLVGFFMDVLEGGFFGCL